MVMGDSGKLVLVQKWTWEENKLFELALAAVDQKDPSRWEAVAAMIGGRKSREDVEQHFTDLLQDIYLIESGQLDYKIEDSVISAYPRSICWTRGSFDVNPSVLARTPCSDCPLSCEYCQWRE